MCLIRWIIHVARSVPLRLRQEIWPDVVQEMQGEVHYGGDDVFGLKVVLSMRLHDFTASQL